MNFCSYFAKLQIRNGAWNSTDQKACRLLAEGKYFVPYEKRVFLRGMASQRLCHSGGGALLKLV